MIKAMIFDLDGTLVQTEELKALSYARAAKCLLPTVQEDAVLAEFVHVVGLSRQEVAQHLLEHFNLTDAATKLMAEYGVATPWEAYVQVRQTIYEKILADPAILLKQRIPHNMALVDKARRELGKVGLATMSYWPQAQKVLSIVGLQDKFDFIASREDVEQGKPDPEIYLLVAHKLGVPPTECLVIEDSAIGVQSALNAGMPCIAVSTYLTQAGLHSGNLLPPRWIVDDPATLFQVVDQMIQGQQ